MNIPISRKKSRHVDAPQGAGLLKDEQQRLDARLLPFADHLLGDWCGEVRVLGAEIVMRNPLRDDQSLGSFKFNTESGAWSDFAATDFAGYGLVSLYCHLKQISLHKALPDLKALSITLAAASGTSADQSPPTQSVPPRQKPKVEAVDPDEVRLPPDLHPDLGAPTKVWEYRDKDGKLAFYVYRFDHDGKKETRPVAWSPEKNAWVWQYPAPPYPLYRLPALLARKDAAVVITEGEKAADASARQFPDAEVITSVCGSEQALRSDWSPLKERQVIIAPDRDEPGRHYALSVASAALVHGATSIHIVDVWALEGWNKGDDLADHDVTTNFLDAARPVTEFFSQTQLEPHVVSAAATLSLGDFDRCKKSLAAQLGIDLRTFQSMVKEARSAGKAPDKPTANDDPFGDAALEPWHEPVEGDALFKEILTLIQRHVILGQAQAVAIAVWIAFSYGFELMRICPQLLINSPSKRCGKSTLLELIMYLVQRALPAANISSAAVYRAIDTWKPTLLIDEADTFLNGKTSDEITGILNSGHSRSLAYVVRTVEVDGEHVPKHFSTFCPKVIAMIKAPADTIIDRSIVITLTRKLSSQRVDALAIDASERFHDTRRRLLRWVEDNREAIVFDADSVPPMSNDRARQNWSVLAAFAKALGDTAYAALIQAVTELGDTAEAEDNIEVDLLADLRDIVAGKPGSVHIASGILVKELLDLKHRPWCEVTNGKPLTENTLARLLKPFMLTPEKYRDGTQTKRGYARTALQEVFDRYLINATEATV